MQKVTQYTAPKDSDPPVLVRCTQVSSRMQIQEDAATLAAMQGFIYALAYLKGGGDIVWSDDVTVPPQLEPTLIAGYPGDHPPNTVPIGNGGSAPYPVAPGGPVTQGTVICRVRSATGSATTINVTEN